MSGPLFNPEDEAATPLEPEELEQLIPTYITSRAELNEVEQISISKADRWAFSKRRPILEVKALCVLHKRMFKDVWKWAGQYRTTARNIGIDAWQIPMELEHLVDDVAFWMEHKTYDPDEIAIRFHHKLVFIHPFPNGNGRWARLASDMLIRDMGHPRFTWGQNNLVDIKTTRKAYITALRRADDHEIQDLLEFVRS